MNRYAITLLGCFFIFSSGFCLNVRCQYHKKTLKQAQKKGASAALQYKAAVAAQKGYYPPGKSEKTHKAKGQDLELAEKLFRKAVERKHPQAIQDYYNCVYPTRKKREMCYGLKPFDINKDNAAILRSHLDFLAESKPESGFSKSTLNFFLMKRDKERLASFVTNCSQEALNHWRSRHGKKPPPGKLVKRADLLSGYLNLYPEYKSKDYLTIKDDFYDTRGPYAYKTSLPRHISKDYMTSVQTCGTLLSWVGKDGRLIEKMGLMLVKTHTVYRRWNRGQFWHLAMTGAQIRKDNAIARAKAIGGSPRGRRKRMFNDNGKLVLLEPVVALEREWKKADEKYIRDTPAHERQQAQVKVNNAAFKKKWDGIYAASKAKKEAETNAYYARRDAEDRAEKKALKRRRRADYNQKVRNITKIDKSDVIHRAANDAQRFGREGKRARDAAAKRARPRLIPTRRARSQTTRIAKTTKSHPDPLAAQRADCLKNGHRWEGNACQATYNINVPGTVCAGGGDKHCKPGELVHDPNSEAAKKRARKKEAKKISNRQRTGIRGKGSSSDIEGAPPAGKMVPNKITKPEWKRGDIIGHFHRPSSTWTDGVDSSAVASVTSRIRFRQIGGETQWVWIMENRNRWSVDISLQKQSYGSPDVFASIPGGGEKEMGRWQSSEKVKTIEGRLSVKRSK